MFFDFKVIKLWILEKLKFFQYKGFHPNFGLPSKPNKRKRWN